LLKGNRGLPRATQTRSPSVPAAVAAEQAKRLALTLAASVLAVIVADSHYAKHLFKAVFHLTEPTRAGGAGPQSGVVRPAAL